MQKVNLNLIPGGVRPVINVSQYDEGRQFQLAIFNGSASYDLTGKTVIIEVGKLDGNGVAYDETDEVNNVPVVAVSRNIVTITTPKQMTAVAGQNNAELKISDSTAVIGTLNFLLDCEQSALSPDTPLSDTEIPALEELASQSAQKALNAVSHYPYIDDTTKNWFVWDVETGAFVDTGVRAQGIDGEGSVKSVNNVSPGADGDVSLGLSDITTVPITTANGGTGNADGYIRTGQAGGSTAGTKATIEGNNNIASGANGIICGDNNTAWSYNNCLVAGEHNKASADNQIVAGKYNASGSNYLLILGNGTDANNTSNALSVNNKGEMLIGLAEDAYAPASDFASFESHMTASAANPHNASHTPGTYLYVPHKFYRVISQTTISQTESFVVGTNIEEVRLADVLSQLNSDITHETGTMTAPQGGVVSQILLPVLVKENNVVHLSCACKLGSTLNGNTLYAMLQVANGYKPLTTSYVTAIISNSSGQYATPALAQMETDGTLNIFTPQTVSITGATWIVCINGTYIV